MNRRTLLTGACAAGAGVALAPALAWADFVSDRFGVTVEGSGPDVILIPGLGSHPDVWDSTVAHLGGRWRTHRLHLSGFAGRPVGGNGGEGPVAAPVAEDIAAYIRARGLNKPIVIGHSMGGTIGLMLAARHPDLVGRLMVVDQVPFMGAFFGPPGTTPESVRPTAAMIRDSIAAATPETARTQTEQAINTMIRTESERARHLQHSLNSDNGVTARAMHELIVTDLRPELDRITAPTTVLFVRGPNIPVTDEQLEMFYRQAYAPVPNVKTIRIPNAWHFIMQDEPARFFAELDAFLSAE